MSGIPPYTNYKEFYSKEKRLIDATLTGAVLCIIIVLFAYSCSYEPNPTPQYPVLHEINNASKAK